MNSSRLIVVSSAHAYVDPCVQVHDSKCSHGLIKWYSDDWAPAGPYESVAAAERGAERAARQVGAVGIAWYDCALLSPVALRRTGITS